MLKKRFLPVLIIAGIVLVPACQKKQDASQSLKGMEIIIGNYWSDYDVNTYKPKSEIDELTLDHRKKIQADNDFIISERRVAGWDRMPQLTVQSIMAGTPAAQVFVLQPDWAMSLYKQNLLFPVNTAKSVNLTGKDQPVEWNMAVHDVFTFGKNTYAFQAQGYGGSLHATVVFFNKRLFREAGLDPDLLYDLQKSGQWTWDKFLEISRQLTRDVNNDGIMDTYATTADFTVDILDAFVAGNGAMYVDKDPKTGKLINATNRPEFLEALQFVVALQREGIMMPKPEGAAWDWYKPMFNDGRVAMRIETEYVRNDLAKMRDDWGMVLPPKGPRANDYVVYTDENVMVIPSIYKKEQVDAILWAVQAWYTPVERNWRLSLYPVFRDVRAVNETMAMIRDPARQMWKYHSLVPGFNRGNMAWEMWFFDGEPAQLIESVSNNWNLVIENANKAQ